MLRMLALLPDSDFEELPIEKSRAQIDMEARLVSGRPIPMASVESLAIPGPAGPVPARMFRPAGLPTSAPLLVYFHGGGFVLGSLDSGAAAILLLPLTAIAIATRTLDTRIKRYRSADRAAAAAVRPAMPISERACFTSSSTSAEGRRLARMPRRISSCATPMMVIQATMPPLSSEMA